MCGRVRVVDRETVTREELTERASECNTVPQRRVKVGAVQTPSNKVRDDKLPDKFHCGSGAEGFLCSVCLIEVLKAKPEVQEQGWAVAKCCNVV